MQIVYWLTKQIHIAHFVNFRRELDYLDPFSIIFIFCFFMDRLMAVAKGIFQKIHENKPLMKFVKYRFLAKNNA